MIKHYKNHLGVLGEVIDGMFLRNVEAYELPITAYYQLIDISEIDKDIQDFDLFAAIYFCLFRQISEGSTCIDLASESIIKEIASSLQQEKIEKRLSTFCEYINTQKKSKIFGSTSSHSLFIFRFHDNSRLLFTNKHYSLEFSVSENIKKLVALNQEIDGAGFDQFVSNLKSLNISAEQTESIRMVIKNHISVISGGPGTGKTFVLSAIIYYFLVNGFELHDISVAAPTGKAANRVSESLGKFVDLISNNTSNLLKTIEPKTLHRLLGISSSRSEPFFNKRNPLQCKLLIIDESSMIDIHLMEAILNGIDCAKTKVVFIGDANQLPSIASGNLLVDLLELLPQDKKMLLTKCFRSETVLSSCFDFIKNKQVDLFLQKLQNISSLKEFDRGSSNVYHIDLSIAKNHELFESSIAFWLSHILYEGYTENDFKESKILSDEEISTALNNINKNKIITSMNIGLAGVDEINRMALKYLHKRFKLSSKVLPNYCPIMILKNNYPKSLFNGDQGMIFRSKGILKAFFETSHGLKSFYLDELPEYIPSFALTVHKCQGSEYENLLFIPTTSDHESLNNTPMIYTALTRCKKNAVILGDLNLLKIGLNRTLFRQTGLYKSG